MKEDMISALSRSSEYTLFKKALSHYSNLSKKSVALKNIIEFIVLFKKDIKNLSQYLGYSYV